MYDPWIQTGGYVAKVTGQSRLHVLRYDLNLEKRGSFLHRSEVLHINSTLAGH